MKHVGLAAEVTETLPCPDPNSGAIQCRASRSPEWLPSLRAALRAASILSGHSGGPRTLQSPILVELHAVTRTRSIPEVGKRTFDPGNWDASTHTRKRLAQAMLLNFREGALAVGAGATCVHLVEKWCSLDTIWEKTVFHFGIHDVGTQVLATFP